MKAKWTLVPAILFLAILAAGLVPVQAAPAGTGACDWQAQMTLAPVASQAEGQATSVPLPVFAAEWTGPGDCTSFCAIVLCPDGPCGPTPSGYCGCQSSGGDILGPQS